MRRAAPAGRAPPAGRRREARRRGGRDRRAVNGNRDPCRISSRTRPRCHERPARSASSSCRSRNRPIAGDACRSGARRPRGARAATIPPIAMTGSDTAAHTAASARRRRRDGRRACRSSRIPSRRSDSRRRPTAPPSTASSIVCTERPIRNPAGADRPHPVRLGAARREVNAGRTGCQSRRRGDR